MHVRTLASLLTVVSLCSTLPAGCSGHHPAPAFQPPQQDVVLEVDNHNWSDVQLYIMHDGATTRFLQVTAAKSASVTIPSRLIGSNGMVRFIAHRIGGLDDYYSPEVSVRTAQTVALTLEGQLNMSSVGVW